MWPRALFFHFIQYNIAVPKRGDVSGLLPEFRRSDHRACELRQLETTQPTTPNIDLWNTRREFISCIIWCVLTTFGGYRSSSDGSTSLAWYFAGHRRIRVCVISAQISILFLGSFCRLGEYLHSFLLGGWDDVANSRSLSFDQFLR